MCFFISLMPATFWLVVGYLVLLSSTKAEGGVKTFGTVLAIWIFIITAFIPIAGAYVAFSNLCPIEQIMENFHLGEGV